MNNKRDEAAIETLAEVKVRIRKEAWKACLQDFADVGIRVDDTLANRSLFHNGYTAGFAAAGQGDGWCEIDRENKSLRWLLMRDKNGLGGIRLGRPEEEGGWRLVDEFGNSTWQPDVKGHYLAQMALWPPTDVPFTPPVQDAVPVGESDRHLKPPKVLGAIRGKFVPVGEEGDPNDKLYPCAKCGQSWSLCPCTEFRPSGEEGKR